MPEDTQPVQSTEPKTSVLGKNVPNPLAKNPNVHTHKVLATVGLILIGVISILGILAYVYRDQVADLFDTKQAEETTTTKVSTSSAKTSTSSAKKDETSDWKTYTSSQLGFSIKYPEEFQYIKEQLSSSNSQIPSITFSNNSDFNSIDPKITSFSVSKGNFKSDYEAIEALEIGKSYSRTIEGAGTAVETRLSNPTVDNVPGIKRSYSPSIEGNGVDYSLTIYLKKGSDYYKIHTISGTKDNFEKKQTIFDQMVSTFKFL